jgi:hypothetical protein
VRQLKVTDFEANPEATEAVMEQQKVRIEERIVDAVGALKGRFRDRPLAVKRHKGRGNEFGITVGPGRSWPPIALPFLH